MVSVWSNRIGVECATISGGTSHDILHGTSHLLVLQLLILMLFCRPRGAAMIIDDVPCRFGLWTFKTNQVGICPNQPATRFKPQKFGTPALTKK
jgi:hypothetical protein